MRLGAERLPGNDPFEEEQHVDGSVADRLMRDADTTIVRIARRAEIHRSLTLRHWRPDRPGSGAGFADGEGWGSDRDRCG